MGLASGWGRDDLGPSPLGRGEPLGIGGRGVEAVDLPRTYYWDGPLCWIDDRRLAVWGYGTDSENLVPAVCLFDVESGRQVRWFAGPSGKLVSDGYLFSTVQESGTSVWDVETGERLLRDPAFCPTSYHNGAKVFLTALGGARFRLSRLMDQ